MKTMHSFFPGQLMNTMLQIPAAGLTFPLPTESRPARHSFWAAPDQNQDERVSGKLIFIVDDYPGLADLAKFLLESAGWEVKAFRERDKALAAFISASPRPFLLITDFRGGSMSGVDLIRACKALQPELKALLVSGVTHRHISDSDLRLIDGSLSKPYCTSLLIQEVRRLAVSTSPEMIRKKKVLV